VRNLRRFVMLPRGSVLDRDVTVLCKALRLLAVVVLCVTPLAAQEVPSEVHPVHRPFDQLLDVYVRDGFVYYNALRLERRRLDAYVASLNGPGAIALSKGSVDEQKALWINAYNALVLRTVIDHFPIRGRAKEYPASSIRQIPGAFEKAIHRVAGRTVSLDSIEKEILAPLGDARVFLALGRGSYGGGRLRSEAFDRPTIEKLLDAVVAETGTRVELVRIDEAANTVWMSPIFSWREPVFVASLADKAPAVFAQRSGLERAVLALIYSHVTTPERLFLEKNTFKMQFHQYDWRLNDLGTR
jgi:hypothetical protein